MVTIILWPLTDNLITFYGDVLDHLGVSLLNATSRSRNISHDGQSSNISVLSATLQDNDPSLDILGIQDTSHAVNKNPSITIRRIG